MVTLDFRNCKTVDDVERVFKKDAKPLKVLKDFLESEFYDDND